MNTKEETPVGNIKNANFPVDASGTVYHLGCKKEELAQRVLTVGDYERAEKLSKLLDTDVKIEIRKHRGFVTYTGAYKGVPMSIVSIGMGIPMMDFLVREGRYVVNGPMAVIRYGTCGSVTNVPVGSLAIAKDSVLIRRNPDYWHPSKPSNISPYDISLPCESDPELFENLRSEFVSQYGEERIVTGTNASADSFYSSQGRIDPNFDDQNDKLIDQLIQTHKNIKTLEMETFQLYHLATRSVAPIKAAAATIILANRLSNDFLSNEEKTKLEISGGKACLEALYKQKL
ncbi:uridine phosphorylase [Tieghemostelium lacteum]|uniref:Uridine phosphorylase n=1 Tax=Tieghemostelium lacteum TaxID=361077 RepID=A0A151ZC85_TIELA|nr:uridine phosphorylase [Tieghemostelium lacteum]|eukprot:KYQ91549.1 uridine phosphorylase [Tieghemostelium lacteum]